MNPSIITLEASLPPCNVCVQALAGKVKAEVRSTLTQHGITKFVIKPVKRNYAFELATIPRKEQWVLKVKFAATSSRLPLGLTGLLLSGNLARSTPSSVSPFPQSVVLNARAMAEDSGKYS